MSAPEPIIRDEIAPDAAPRPKLELVVPPAEELEATADATSAPEDETPDPADVVPASEEVDLLRTYVRQIGNGRLLSAREESLLARRKDAGDEWAKARLI